jgi:hypothetical protein
MLLLFDTFRLHLFGLLKHDHKATARSIARLDFKISCEPCRELQVLTAPKKNWLHCAFNENLFYI